MSFLSGFGLTGAKCSFSGNEYSFPQLATLPTPPRNKTEKGMRCFRTILFLATFWPSEIVFFFGCFFLYPGKFQFELCVRLTTPCDYCRFVQKTSLSSSVNDMLYMYLNLHISSYILIAFNCIILSESHIKRPCSICLFC